MKLTGGALELIAKHRFPVHVITKSSLVTRDADLLQDIGALMLPLVLLSLQRMTRWRATGANAPVSSERFKAMKILSDRGIYRGVALMPVLPFINDSIEDMRK